MTCAPSPTAIVQRPAADSGGLLLPELDPWGDSGLLHLPMAMAAEPAEPQSLRSFIAEAYPRYVFAEKPLKKPRFFLLRADHAPIGLVFS